MRRAREQGLSLTGPDGLLKQLTKTVLETALNQEMTEHLGHEKHGRPVAVGQCAQRDPAEDGADRGAPARCGIDVPRDRDGTFEPQIVRKRQRRLTGVDEIVLSLYAKGLRPGRSARTSRRSTARRCSKETISRITDKVVEEMRTGSPAARRRLRGGVHRRDHGQGPRRAGRQPARLRRDRGHPRGEKDILGLWAGTGGEGAKFWMSVLTDLRNRGVQRRVLPGLRRAEGPAGGRSANVWPRRRSRPASST